MQTHADFLHGSESRENWMPSEAHDLASTWQSGSPGATVPSDPSIVLAMHLETVNPVAAFSPSVVSHQWSGLGRRVPATRMNHESDQEMTSRRMLVKNAAVSSLLLPLASQAASVANLATPTLQESAELDALFTDAKPVLKMGASMSEVYRILGRVPVYIITNKEDSPYLTEMDTKQRRSGFMYLSPLDVVKMSKEVNAVDPDAQIRVVSLDNVWPNISKSMSDVYKAPQPKAGATTDLRLFLLQGCADETDNAKKLLKPEQASKLADGAIPLFYDQQIRIQDNGKTVRPFFFRLGDLKAFYTQAKNPDKKNLTEADLKVEPQGLKTQAKLLTVFVDDLLSGAEKDDALLVAPSESTAAVMKMSENKFEDFWESGKEVNESPYNQATFKS